MFAQNVSASDGFCSAVGIGPFSADVFVLFLSTVKAIFWSMKHLL